MKKCRNCATALSGEYCSHCGQRESNRDIRFFDLVGEFISEIIVWDSRIWNTLVPLLFRPGFLTSEFLAGRKARYLPPVRLYLVISFIMFLLISISSTKAVITVDGVKNDELKQQATDALEERLQDESLTEEQKNRIREHTLKHLDQGLIAELDFLTIKKDADSTDNSDATNLDLWDEGQKPAWAKNLEERLSTNVKAVEEDPDLFIEKFVERLPYMMFLLLPLFALLVYCAYLRSPYHYLQHLVFSLHYHSAAFLLGSLSIVLNTVTGYHSGILLFLLCFIYLPVALVRVYGSGYAAVVGKSLLIGLGEAILLLFTLSMLAVISVATL